MIADIITIIWKEFMEILLQRGRFRGGIMGLLVFVAAFGVFMPLQAGREWVQSSTGAVYFIWLPYLLVSGVTADTFAGERERHTLETLLASCLSDRAILFGKLGAAVLYGWGITVINLLIGIVTVNIAFWQGTFLMYPLDLFAGLVVITFLIAFFGAALGVVVSLRAATVRQATQILSIVMMVFFVPILLLPVIPVAVLGAAIKSIMETDIRIIGLIAIGVLLVLDAGLLAFTLSRFQRAKLILD